MIPRSAFCISQISKRNRRSKATLHARKPASEGSAVVAGGLIVWEKVVAAGRGALPVHRPT
jgi:hypothetical protein